LLAIVKEIEKAIVKDIVKEKEKAIAGYSQGEGKGYKILSK
jgi:hypothetical protein